MNRKSINKSGRLFANLAVVTVILLTTFVSMVFFIAVLQNEYAIISKIYLQFFENYSFVIFVIVLCLALILIALYVFNIQVDAMYRDKIKSMYEQLSTDTIKGIAELPVGIISYSLDDKIVWVNDFFKHEKTDMLIGRQLKDILPMLSKQNHDDIKRSFNIYENIAMDDKYVDIYHEEKTSMIYVFDKTKEHNILRKSEQECLVIGYIYVDSPEEIQVFEDAGNIEVSSEMHRIIINWAQKYNAYVRKYASYRWMIVTNKTGLDQMCQTKMDVREQIKCLGKTLKMNVTVSGGFSSYTDNIGEVVRQAIDAIELGQSRGGDQIVVHKNFDDNLIFGGDNNQKKRTSRVMARSTAINLHATLEKFEDVYITGHQYADLDAIGAMLGIYQIAKTVKKNVYFILEIEKLGKDALELLGKTWKDKVALAEILEKVVLPNKFKPEQNTDKSVVIIVDTALSMLVESPKVLSCKNIILIDHHRKGKDAIKNAIIEYIDPFSSSASEMVAELIQYQPIVIDLPSEIATCLLAGIVLDTNKFTRNVSSRTFEAASYLRKQGAIQEYVLQVLSTGIEEYIVQSAYLKDAKSLPNNGKILALTGEKSRPEIAKCADFMLSFAEVNYTIVIAKVSETIVSISGRSKGAANVQRIMEHFGGGGHYNSAAAQVKNQNVYEVQTQITEYIEKEDEK
ncbi:MAG: DHH family phosphoesterase [Culicoidibacterales bacterium]